MSDMFRRVDATWSDDAGQVVSRVTLFTLTELYRHQVARLLDYGWNVQESHVDVSALSPVERAALIGPIWPLLPLETIIDLLRAPPAAANTVYEPVEPARARNDNAARAANGNSDRAAWEQE